MNFNEYFSPSVIGAYWAEKVNEKQPYFGESKFPNAKQIGIDLSWIKGSDKSPVVLSVSALDANAIKLSRGSFDVSTTRMPFFKNILSVDEKLRQDLLLVLQSGNQTAIDVVLNKIYNDQSRLIDDAALTREVIRMQALTTGVVSIANNGQKYTYDYGVPTDHKISVATKWSDANADIIGDITDWQDKIENESGVRPSEMVIENSVLKAMADNASIRNAIYVFGNGTVRPSNDDIKQYIYDQTGVTVYVYNKGYTDESGKFVKFVPAGTVVLMPESALGNTWFGTTPEEATFSAGLAHNLAVVDTGVALTSEVSFDPVVLNTKVSEIFLPSFESADEVIMASVL